MKRLVKNVYIADKAPVVSINRATERRVDPSLITAQEGTEWIDMVSPIAPDAEEGKMVVNIGAGAVEVDGVWEWHTARFEQQDKVVVVPESITPAQFKIALLQAGIFTEVKALVNGAGGEVVIWWDSALEVRRDNPLIAALNAQLETPLTSGQIDVIFLAGEEIE